MTQTQPGTLSHRVVEWLKTQPRGKTFSTAEICDVLGIDTSGFTTSMATAARMGLVARTAMPYNRRLVLWSLGNGVPVDDEGEAPPRTAWVKPRDFDTVQPPKTEQPIAPKAAPKPEAQLAPPKFRAALWTDGWLQITLGEGVVVLKPGQVEELRRLLGGRAA
jgi:hypothetical protein